MRTAGIKKAAILFVLCCLGLMPLQAGMVHIDSAWIYYLDNQHHLYSVKEDGTQNQLLTEQRVDDFKVAGDKVIYTVYTQEEVGGLYSDAAYKNLKAIRESGDMESKIYINELWMMDKDGTHQKLLLKEKNIGFREDEMERDIVDYTPLAMMGDEVLFQVRQLGCWLGDGVLKTNYTININKGTLNYKGEIFNGSFGDNGGILIDGYLWRDASIYEKLSRENFINQHLTLSQQKLLGAEDKWNIKKYMIIGSYNQSIYYSENTAYEEVGIYKISKELDIPVKIGVLNGCDSMVIVNNKCYGENEILNLDSGIVYPAQDLDRKIRNQFSFDNMDKADNLYFVDQEENEAAPIYKLNLDSYVKQQILPAVKAVKIQRKNAY